MSKQTTHKNSGPAIDTAHSPDTSIGEILKPLALERDRSLIDPTLLTAQNQFEQPVERTASLANYGAFEQAKFILDQAARLTSGEAFRAPDLLTPETRTEILNLVKTLASSNSGDHEWLSRLKGIFELENHELKEAVVSALQDPRDSSIGVDGVLKLARLCGCESDQETAELLGVFRRAELAKGRTWYASMAAHYQSQDDGRLIESDLNAQHEQQLLFAANRGTWLVDHTSSMLAYMKHLGLRIDAEGFMQELNEQLLKKSSAAPDPQKLAAIAPYAEGLAHLHAEFPETFKLYDRIRDKLFERVESDYLNRTDIYKDIKCFEQGLIELLNTARPMGWQAEKMEALVERGLSQQIDRTNPENLREMKARAQIIIAMALE